MDFLLPNSAKRQYQQGKIAKQELLPYAEQIEAMSTLYVGIQNVKLSKKQVEAYALYYLPINFAKIAFLLKQNLQFKGQTPIRVLDFGCGPGTAALAACNTIKNPVAISLSDASSSCTSLASQLVNMYRKDASINTISNFSEELAKTFDLVIAANVISEVSEANRTQLINLLLNLVDDNGYLILLVPALKITSQQLMLARDYILKSYPEFFLTFPCSKQDACPMLKEGLDDWCHGELPHQFWEKTALVSQFDELLGFNKHRVKYSALILQRTARKTQSGYKIIRPSGKNHPALLCGEKGLIRIDPKGVKNSDFRRILKNGSSYQTVELDPNLLETSLSNAKYRGINKI